MEQYQKTESFSVEETEALGAKIAREMLANPSLPSFLALYGDLGVGKTAFVRGFVSVVSPNAAVRSPTFALVREYPARPRPVFHFDCYRIESEDDLISIGFEDYLNRGGICLCEWSEKIVDFLPEARIEITIQKDDLSSPDHRTIAIEQRGTSR